MRISRWPAPERSQSWKAGIDTPFGCAHASGTARPQDFGHPVVSGRTPAPPSRLRTSTPGRFRDIFFFGAFPVTCLIRAPFT